MENIILKKWNYVDLLINSQVIRLGNLFGGERVNVFYTMVLLIDVTQPHFIVEYVEEKSIHPCKIMDLRINIGISKYQSM